MPDGPIPADALVVVSDVGVRFGPRTVLSHVDLTLRRGEIVTLIGPNGCGKTTLVRVVLGLTRPDSGTVRRDTAARIGYVPQYLNVDRTLPLTVRRFLSVGTRATAAQATGVLAEIGVAHLAGAAFQDLSGGEIKRVALARALLRQPDLLVLDEPTANVDVTGQAELYEMIRAIRDARGCGVLLVSHDLHLVMASTDTVVCLNTHVCCVGRPESVTRHPEYLALFGPEIATSHGVYAHDHDHSHTLSGEPVDPEDAGHG